MLVKHLDRSSQEHGQGHYYADMDYSDDEYDEYDSDSADDLFYEAFQDYFDELSVRLPAFNSTELTFG